MTNNRLNQYIPFVGGIAFTFLIALIGFLFAKIPGIQMIGQMGCAIILAVIFRQIWGYPSNLAKGIQFSSKILLRLAIILYGLKLNISILLSEGPILLMKDILVIAFAIFFMLWLSKKYFKGNSNISLLLGIGTGVCGAAAIAAVAPIVKSDDDETAISVGIIALIGTIFSIAYTLLYPILTISASDYGIWSGLSLHELAHVALAAAPAGEDPLTMALLAKLGRVFFLVPLCFILIWVMNRKNKQSNEPQKIAFPYFLIGFVIMSILGSYVIGPIITVPESILNGVNILTTWCLTMAMVGLGLNIHLKEVRTKALKPLIAMIITSICLSFLSYLIL
ncbi:MULTISPECIES: YeiH family protein [Bacillus]|uniref:YeiH family protein n=1 Tax=Bacillus TaxID=1386 RepID=UPI00030FB0C6|nr:MULTISPECIES: putative sulfate exporter family transporter [Bacillus]